MKERPCDWAGPFLVQALVSTLYGSHTGCTRALLALSNLELDLLTFIERGVTLGFDLRVVDEQVLAAVIRSDETESLGRIEPLYRTSAH
jgi:hypothetical protein